MHEPIQLLLVLVECQVDEGQLQRLLLILGVAAGHRVGLVVVLLWVAHACLPNLSRSCYPAASTGGWVPAGTGSARTGGSSVGRLVPRRRSMRSTNGIG